MSKLPEGNPNISMPVLLRTSVNEEQQAKEAAVKEGRTELKARIKEEPKKDAEVGVSGCSWLESKAIEEADVYSYPAWKEVKEYLEVELLIKELS